MKHLFVTLLLVAGVRGLFAQTITTEQPYMIQYPTADSLCTNSALEGLFTSSGSYGANNVYSLELSDENGAFPGVVIGTFASSHAFVQGGGTWGKIAGKVPLNTAEGCAYYLRVVSSSPARTGTTWGPFCLKHCDISTDDDVIVCIEDATTITATLSVNIHTWDNHVTYTSNNKFSAQALDVYASPRNTGGLGFVTASTDTTITLVIPKWNNLSNLNLSSGPYLVRVVADHGSDPSEAQGNIVRLYLGHPEDPAEIWIDANKYCNDTYATINIDNYNDFSVYTWQGQYFNNGDPFIRYGNRLDILLGGFPPRTYSIRVKENNVGCEGSYSLPVSFELFAPAKTNLAGSLQVCSGGEYNYSVPLVGSTGYEWSVTGGATIIDSPANTVKLLINDTGAVTLSLQADNYCGTQNKNYNIRANGGPAVIVGLPALVCTHESVFNLSGDPSGGTFTGPGIIQGHFFFAQQAGVGTHQIIYEAEDSNGCSARDTMDVIVDLCDIIAKTNSDALQRVYPVPAAQSLFIEWGYTIDKNVPVQFYDAAGALIYVAKQIISEDSHASKVDISALPNGVYLLRVGKEVMRKVVVLR